jgi:hypothetical protein
MSAESNSFGRFDLLLSFDFKYANTFRKNTDEACILSVPFNVFHGTQCKICHYLSNRFTMTISNRPIS